MRSLWRALLLLLLLLLERALREQGSSVVLRICKRLWHPTSRRGEGDLDAASSEPLTPPRRPPRLPTVRPLTLSLDPLSPLETPQATHKRAHTRLRRVPTARMLSSLAPSAVLAALPSSAAGAWRHIVVQHDDLPEPLRFLPSAFRILALLLFVPVAALAVVSRPPPPHLLPAPGEVRHEPRRAEAAATWLSRPSRTTLQCRRAS